MIDLVSVLVGVNIGRGRGMEFTLSPRGPYATKIMPVLRWLNLKKKELHHMKYECFITTYL